jgi:UDP-N-acetyl-2-amino-2-deoxyglucuronate dehydrogenase
MMGWGRKFAETRPKQGSALRVGMIGCGEIAYSATARALKAATNARLVLVMDVNPELASSMGRTYGVPHTTDLQEVLQNPLIDAVLISTPHDQHEPLTFAAAGAGKHVMCEKPIACTVEQANRMILACEAAGVCLGVNMIARYEAVTRVARDLVASGAIGRVIGLNVHFTIRKPDAYWDGGFTGRSLSPWRRYWTASGGGTLMINIIHELDRLCFISSLDVVSASAEIATLGTDVEVEDTASVTYRFSNGALGSITASSCAPGNRSFGVQIIGTEGQITFGAVAAGLLRETINRKRRVYMLRRTLPAPLLALVSRGSMQVFTLNDIPGLKRGRWTKVRVPGRANARKLYIEAFADAVRTGRRPDIDGEDGRKILEAVLTAYHSARTGTRRLIRDGDGPPLAMEATPSLGIAGIENIHAKGVGAS